jgi:hypothetical protein
MLQPFDNNNIEFTDNCLSYLRGDDPERNQVLFVEEGRINPVFDVKLKTMTVPEVSEEALLALINHQINNLGDRVMALEDADVHNRFLFHRISPRALVRNVLLLLTLAGFTYLACRVGLLGRHRIELGLASFGRLVQRQAPSGTVLEQREATQIASGNLRELARDRARQALAEAGFLASGGEPRFRCGWAERVSLRRKLARLTVLAGPAPARVRPAGLRQLERDAADLRTARERGTLQIVD